MPRLDISAARLPLVALLGALLVGPAVRAAPKDSAKNAADGSGVVGGLVIDKRDDSITVQVDGEDEPTKYLIGEGTDKRSREALKSIFGVNRVNLKYKTDGAARRVVTVEKVPGRPTGVVTGEVLKVYDNFWVAVKPKDGPPEGYALNWPPAKFKAAGDVVKSLKKGDLVAIRYSTDGERHRIQQIEVKPAPTK